MNSPELSAMPRLRHTFAPDLSPVRRTYRILESDAARRVTSSQVPSSEPSSTTMCSHAWKLCAATESMVSRNSFRRLFVGVMTETTGPLTPPLALKPRLAHHRDGK